MKILTKEEEDAHYRETLKGGSLGMLGGFTLGALGVYGAAARYPAFRQLTLPLRAFLVTSSTTFGGIVTADHFSRAFESSQHPDEGFQDSSARTRALENSRKSALEKARDWGKENRYTIVGTSWVLSMVLALGITGRNPFLSTQQKLVQARVYAQGLTVAVLIATAAFEIGDRGKGEGRWETVRIVDPEDPERKRVVETKVHHERYEGEDQWRDMVEAEEQKQKARDEAAKEQERKDEESGKWKRKEKEREQHEKGKKNEHKEGKKEGGGGGGDGDGDGDGNRVEKKRG